MKKLLISLPLLAIAAGCSSSDADMPQGAALVKSINDKTVASASVIAQYTKDTDKDLLAKGDSKPTPKAGATPTKAKPKTPPTYVTPKAGKTYKVKPEGQPGMGEDMLAELKKVQVPPPPAKMKIPSRATVDLVTTKGTITVELNGKEAPLHVKSFLYLSQRGFFDGTVFHRHEPGFVIQGGDPISKNENLADSFGQGGPGFQIPRETNKLKHDKYVLAAARTSDPDSAGSQFYITLEPAPNLDQPPGYTVYGKVIKGQDVVDQLTKGDKLTKATVTYP